MKSVFIHCILITVLMLGSGLTNSAIAQPDNYNCTCVLCHVPCNAPLSSHTNPECPVGKRQTQGYGDTGSSSSGASPVYDVGSKEADDWMKTLYQEQSVSVNNRGVKQYKKGNYQAAAALFRKALQYYPNYEKYRKNLSNAEEMIDRENAAKNSQKIKQQAAQRYLDEMKAFSNSINETKTSYQKVQKKLHKQLGSYVPPIASRKIIKEGVILGMSNTKDSNAIKKYDLKSPFSDNKIPFYATSDNYKVSDLGRVTLDNLTTGKYTTLKTEVGQELVKELDNTYFEVLMAHSNGATVTEALLRADVIRAKELHIMGGDRSLTNMGGYADLIATGKVEKVVVWLNPADYVPYGTSVFDLLMNGSHDKDLQVENFNAYFQHIIDEMKATDNIEYHWMWGPEYTMKGQNCRLNFDAHGLEVYFENIRRFRQLNAERQKEFNFNMMHWLE